MSLRFFQRTNAVAAAPAQTRERIALTLEDGRSVEVLRVRDARAKRIDLRFGQPLGVAYRHLRIDTYRIL